MGWLSLQSQMVKETLDELGEVLYNLYGTSEAGLNIIATPRDLSLFPNTIGRKIKGGRLKIVDDHKEEVKLAG